MFYVIILYYDDNDVYTDTEYAACCGQAVSICDNRL